MLSDTKGSAHVYARVLIYKEVAGADQAFCEYADGADNNGASAEVSKVPMDTSVTSISDKLDMGIGSTLDCKTTNPAQPKPSNGVVQDIWVPNDPTGPNGVASYDVATTFAFK